MKIWLPTIRAGTGADVYTERLAAGLKHRGVAATVTWFNHYNELVPWLLKRQHAPDGTDIIHANSVYGFALHRPGAKLIVTVHHRKHDAQSDMYKSILQRIYQKHLIYHYESRSFMAADRTTAVSRSVAEHVHRVFGVPSPAIIYNGIDCDIYTPQPARRSDKRFRLLFVGKPSRGKGFDLLQPIMEKLGEGFFLYYTGRLSSQIRSSWHNTKNLGRLDVNALPEMYRDCDALLFPTRFEGFGYAVCEAMACGKPVIASDNSSLPELVRHNETGILCKTDDIDAFVDAARLLAADPLLAMRMGEAGRKHVLRSFTLEQMTDKYIRLYEEVLSS